MATEGKSHDSVARVSVYGHERALAALTGALASGRAPQALLLLGPASIGRSAVALRLAQHLFCRSVEGERPCGSCRACRLVAAGTHPDLLTTEVPLKVEAGAHREAVSLLERAVAADGNHSAAYLALGRAWEGLGEPDRAREVYATGVGVAARRGDLKTANAMHERLGQLDHPRD